MEAGMPVSNPESVTAMELPEPVKPSDQAAEPPMIVPAATLLWSWLRKIGSIQITWGMRATSSRLFAPEQQQRRSRRLSSVHRLPSALVPGWMISPAQGDAIAALRREVSQGELISRLIDLPAHTAGLPLFLYQGR
jgi:hypothetical protein